MSAFAALLLAFVAIAFLVARDGEGFATGPWRDSEGRPLPDGLNREAGNPLVLHVFEGPAHCDWQSASFLLLSWPLGTVARGSLPAPDVREYVSDPKGVLGRRQLRSRLDQSAGLPPDATTTGYHNDDWELWIASDADDYVYLVGEDRVERWPRSLEPFGCA